MIHQLDAQSNVPSNKSIVCNSSQVQFPVSHMLVNSTTEPSSDFPTAIPYVKNGSSSVFDSFVSSASSCNKDTMSVCNNETSECNKQLASDFQTEMNISQALTVNKSKSVSSDVLHRRLGHTSLPILKKVINLCNSKLNTRDNSNILSFCDACKHGKQHWEHFPKAETKSVSPLELIHTDLWGPSPTISKEGYKYYIHFVDDYTRYTWIYPLKTKVEALQVFVLFHKLVERQFSTKLKIVQSD